MLDINIETLDITIEGLKLLSNFGELLPDTQILPRQLSFYHCGANYCIDNWQRELVSLLFSTTITHVEQKHITYAEDILEEFKSFSPFYLDVIQERFEQVFPEVYIEDLDLSNTEFATFLENEFKLCKTIIRSSIFSSIDKASLIFSTTIPWLLEYTLDFTNHYLQSSYLYRNKKDGAIDFVIYTTIEDYSEFELYLDDIYKKDIFNIFNNLVIQAIHDKK